jgi:hypothetical protein
MTAQQFRNSLLFFRPGDSHVKRPQSAMPRELQDSNPRKIWRLVDGEVAKDAL